MTPKRAALAAGVAVLAFALGWVMFAGLPRWAGGSGTSAVGTSADSEAAAGPGRKIKARLFYVSETGTKLQSVEHDVPFGEDTVQQAREIINAQIAPVAAPLVSAVPPGTALRAIFITGNGDAFVDLSREASSAHPGGTLNELLTVYTIVNALTANLPAVAGVQILIGGKEVDTLAGHVDLRRPLARDLGWVE